MAFGRKTFWVSITKRVKQKLDSSLNLINVSNFTRAQLNVNTSVITQFAFAETCRLITLTGSAVKWDSIAG